MHQQVIARYNAERFSNNLSRVLPFNNLREPIAEGYFPKMDSLVASRAWPPRFENTKLSDLNREADQLNVEIGDLERWRDRIYEAIHQGFVMDVGYWFPYPLISYLTIFLFPGARQPGALG